MYVCLQDSPDTILFSTLYMPKPSQPGLPGIAVRLGSINSKTRPLTFNLYTCHQVLVVKPPFLIVARIWGESGPLSWRRRRGVVDVSGWWQPVSDGSLVTWYGGHVAAADAEFGDVIGTIWGCQAKCHVTTHSWRQSLHSDYLVTFFISCRLFLSVFTHQPLALM